MSSDADARAQLRLNQELVDAIAQAQQRHEVLVTQGIIITPDGAPRDGVIYAGPLAKRMAEQQPEDGDWVYTTDDDQPLASAEDAEPADASAPVPTRAARQSQKPPLRVYRIWRGRKKKDSTVRLKDVCAEFGADPNSVSAAASRDRREKKAMKTAPASRRIPH